VTTSGFSKLSAGTKVVWREGYESPRRGEITEQGVVMVGASLGGPRKFVKWGDGQENDGSDDWALKNIEKAESPA